MGSSTGCIRAALACLGCLGILLGPTGGAWTQERVTLSLDQLIQMALERSPEMGQAEQDLAASESDLAQAKAARWAQLDAVAIGGIVDAADRPIVVVSPRPGPGDRYLRGRIENPDWDPGDMGPFGRLEITVVQPLYTFGKISNRIDAAVRGVAVQKAAKDKTKGDVILRVKELYFALLLARQGKEAASDVESFVEDARRRIQKLLSLGSASVDESDLYRLEAYAAEAKRFKAKADSGSKLAYMALKQAVGFPQDKEFELDVKELPKDTRALGDQRQYIEQALRLRPELEQIENGLEARKSLVEAAKADMYPSVFLAGIASLAGAPNREHMDVAYIGDDFNHANGGVVLGAKWHFDLGIQEAKVSKAKAEYQRLLHTREHALRNIPLEVVKHYQNAVESLQAFQASEQAAVAARKWVVVAFANFDMGVGQARDIFFAVERYGKNQGDYLLSLLNYHLALARLSNAVGEYRAASR
ncbi:MAG: TolC family protein [Thermodesulfobacteriota bacterium]